MARTQHWIKCNIFSQPSDPPGLVARRSVIYFRLEIISTIIKSNSYTCPHSDMRAAPPPAPPLPEGPPPTLTPACCAERSHYPTYGDTQADINTTHGTAVGKLNFMTMFSVQSGQ